MVAKNSSEEQIPIPEETYLPVKFWVDLLSTLDFKVKVLATSIGYGFVNLRISIYDGRVANVHFNDEVSMKKLVDQYFPKTKINDEKVDKAQ